MRRYFNSFNALKWFKSKFFQQKRKRQTGLQLASNSKEFFSDVVHFIEYGRVVDKVGNQIVTIPIIPVGRLEMRNNRLEVDMSRANSQYFLESLFQSIISYVGGDKDLRKFSILIGGDGRALNSFSIEMFARIAVGNKLGTVILTKDGLLTSAAAREAMREDPLIACSIILTAPTSPGGIKGKFGLQIESRDWKESVSSSTSPNLCWPSLQALIETVSDVRLFPRLVPGLTSSGQQQRFSQSGTEFVYRDVPAHYVTSLLAHYNTADIAAFLRDRDVYFTVDTMHGAASVPVRLLLKALGVDAEGSILNGDSLEDLGRLTPSPRPRYATTTMELFAPVRFNSITILATVRSLLPSMSNESTEASPTEGLNRLTEGGGTTESSPDFGFVLDADGGECLVVGSGMVALPELARSLASSTSRGTLFDVKCACCVSLTYDMRM
jgi:hypothetical protein